MTRGLIRLYAVSDLERYRIIIKMHASKASGSKHFINICKGRKHKMNITSLFR